MAGSEILEAHKKPNLGEYINAYFRDNSEIMGKVRRGLADIKAGRIKSWDKIKRELSPNV